MKLAILLAPVLAFGQHIMPIQGYSTPLRAAQTASIATTTDGNGIDYHGGPVMLGTPMVHTILYGAWVGNPAVPVINDFLTNLGASAYEKINASYHDGAGNFVSGDLVPGLQVFDSFSRGAILTDADIQAIVAAHINVDLPADPNALYTVVVSTGITVTAFGAQFGVNFCGYHGWFTLNGITTKYILVGDATAHGLNCQVQTTGPNGNAADLIVNVFAHEIEEAISDPELNAWYDVNGQENADKCAWTFGQTYIAPNGAKANMKLGVRDFLIQRNWLNKKGGACALVDDSATWPTVTISLPLPNAVYQCDSTNFFSVTASISAVDYLGNPIPVGYPGQSEAAYWQLGTGGNTLDKTGGIGTAALYFQSPLTVRTPCIYGPPAYAQTYYIDRGSVSARVGSPGGDIGSTVSVPFTVKQYVAPPPPPPPPPPCKQRGKSGKCF